MSEEKKVKIDGKEYIFNDLSEQVRGALASLRLVDQKLAEKKDEIAILKTAKNAYLKGLKENLPVDKVVN